MTDSSWLREPAEPASDNPYAEAEHNQVLVLGVGNILLGDDGVGVRVVQALQHDPTGLPDGTQLLDGGTFGLDLIARLDGVERLVLVDAVGHGAAPGTVGTWHGQDVARIFNNPLSVHQVGIDELFGALTLLGQMPPEAVVVGVEPGACEPGLGLTPEVEASLDQLRAAVVAAANGES